MPHLRLILLLMVCSLFENAKAQVSITEVMDPLLAGLDINGVNMNAAGETILFDNNHVFTFVDHVTEDYICDLCYEIQAVASYLDTQYFANKFGGIVKRFGDSLAIVADYEASKLIVNSNGVLYGNDYGNGLFRWNGSTWQLWNESNSNIPSKWVYDLAIDSNGLLWIATYDGLASFNGTTFSAKSIPDDLSAAFYSIAIDENNAVWVSSAYGGLGRFANNAWTTFPQTFSLLQLVQKVGILNGNEAWTASFGNGLYRFNDSQFTNYPPSQFGYSTFESCRFMFGDSQGRLWMDFDNTPLLYLTTGPSAVDNVYNGSVTFTVSPNPSHGGLHVSTPSLRTVITGISIYSIEGQLCYTSTSILEHEVTLNVANLPSGLYTIVVTDESGNRITEKIILQ